MSNIRLIFFIYTSSDFSFSKFPICLVVRSCVSLGLRILGRKIKNRSQRRRLRVIFHFQRGAFQVWERYINKLIF